MATTRPELFTIDGVLNFYRLAGEGATAFAVYAGHRISPENVRFIYEGGNKNDGEGELLSALQAIQESPTNTNVYILQVYMGEKPVRVKKATQSRSITFQLNVAPWQNGVVAQPGNIGYTATNELRQLREEIAAIKAIPAEPDEDEDEENTAPKNAVMMFLGKLLEAPEIQGKIVGAIGKLLDGMLGSNQNKMGAIGAIPAEVSQDEVTKAMERLNVHTDGQALPLIVRLAAYADGNPEMFANLLKMLP